MELRVDPLLALGYFHQYEVIFGHAEFRELSDEKGSTLSARHWCGRRRSGAVLLCRALLSAKVMPVLQVSSMDCLLLGRKGRARVHSDDTIQIACDRFEAIYRRLMNEECR